MPRVKLHEARHPEIPKARSEQFPDLTEVWRQVEVHPARAQSALILQGFSRDLRGAMLHQGGKLFSRLQATPD